MHPFRQAFAHTVRRLTFGALQCRSLPQRPRHTHQERGRAGRSRILRQCPHHGRQATRWRRRTGSLSLVQTSPIFLCVIKRKISDRSKICQLQRHAHYGRPSTWREGRRRGLCAGFLGSCWQTKTLAWRTARESRPWQDRSGQTRAVTEKELPWRNCLTLPAALTTQVTSSLRLHTGNRRSY